MLQRIRRHRRLGTVVLTVVALAWLAALLAGVQVRQAPPAAHAADAFLHDVCSSAEPLAGAGAGAGAPGGAHDSHADPGCLLCLALGAPATLALAAPRPPAPNARRPRTGRASPRPAQRPQAPLPARGPPPALHA